MCFRSLLRARGFVPVGTKTVHGAIEYGKDIAAWHPGERTIYLFQLKAGDVRRADWPGLHTQLFELAAVPYSHPNHVIGAPTQPVLVCTGQVEETLRAAIAGQNYAALPARKVLVWDRETLVNAFSENLFSVQVLTEAVAIDHIRVWSHLSDYGADEDNIWSFLHSYLDRAKGLPARDVRRILAGYVVAVAQLSQRYWSGGDVYGAIDCAILGAVVFYEAVLRQRMRPDVAQFHCKAMRELIIGYLRALHRQSENDQAALIDLTDRRGGPEEVFVLPIRVHSLASKLSLLAFLSDGVDDTAPRVANSVNTIVRHNPAFAHPVSERQSGTLVVALLALLRFGHHDTARDALLEAIDWVAGLCGHRRAPGLPDPYQPLTDAPFHFLGLPQRGDGGELTAQKGSYLLPILVRLCCLLGQRGAIQRNWQFISRTTAQQYMPDDEGEMYTRRSERGELKATVYPLRQSWRKLRDRLGKPVHRRYLSLAQAYPEAPLLLALAYPWRAALCEPSLYVPSFE
ncbi:MAG: hypothetical protein ABSD48_09000 [Armatimonadota bacterium]